MFLLELALSNNGFNLGLTMLLFNDVLKLMFFCEAQLPSITMQRKIMYCFIKSLDSTYQMTT